MGSTGRRYVRSLARSLWNAHGQNIAGGGAYYVAKQQVNKERQVKYDEHQRKKRAQYSLEYSANVPSKPLSSSTMGDTSASPSQEASDDPSPAHQEPQADPAPTSPYGAQKVYRNRKGDRFS